MTSIVVASSNKGKLSEIRLVIESCGIEARVLSQKEAGADINVEETGVTFEENARIKARAVHALCGGIVIADDSGLCVEALHGAPGVYTARFAGEGATDGTNIDKLLAALDGKSDRRASFVSVICCVLPDGTEFFTEGHCNGEISKERAGTGGFGYDPVFMPDGYDKTFAQLGDNIKNKMSHRAKAVTAFAHRLKDYI